MAAHSAGLALALAACVAASLLHHVHNAEYLQDYPNLPGTLTRGGVYAAWLAEAVIAFAGYVLLRFGKEKTGLVLIGLYALTGFGGLAHYYAAPLSAHTLAMNATIWLEALTAALLLVTVLRRIAG
jgi:hypothetical protein